MKNLLSLLLICLLSTTVLASPYFSVDSAMEWEEILAAPNGQNHIERADDVLWQEFEMQREQFLVEGEAVKPSVFLPPDLFVYPGGTQEEYPEEAGLIMAWGERDMPEGDYSSGYSVVYGIDPDLTNSTIKLSVHPPAFITMVSFGLTDINGNQCSWTWNVPADIPHSPPGPPTVIMIDTNNVPSMGLNSSMPACSTFSYNPAFDMRKVISLFINETFHNVPGQFPPPPPGQTTYFYWNAWDWVEVLPNPTQESAYKGYHIKYSQKPEEVDLGLIYGWDQLSYFQYDASGVGNAVVFMAADDWICTDPRPVTDFHWWGSFKGWSKPIPPSIVPDYFLIGIWRDVPADAANPYSHPSQLLWVHRCDKWVWNYAGLDLDPRCNYDPALIDPDYYSMIGQYPLDTPPCEVEEACFQFNQLLSEDEYFKQEEGDNIYWVSIAAVYQNINDPRQIPYPWGWKTKPYDPDKAPDIAVIINDIDNWPPVPFSTSVTGFKPIILPNMDQAKEPFDLAFELSTNQKEPGTCYDIAGDINHDCVVDLADLAIVSADWLKTSTP